ncbi:hypothetical protein MRB53_025179 [Persea americana]|uniref:Uncharacterized protein n=1 Tax=Persea americana TaxID=3435 RepID=A0ACC2LEJ2_PERAE|nr:hypothetical protein MRB53_025179 [Persea americana]
MNLEPPLPPPPRLSSCHLHPDHPVTGFCASCLRERLAGLDPANSSSTLRKPTAAAASSSSSSTAAAALRAIFARGGGGESSSRVRSSSNSKSLLPELRRCKSFSGAKADGVAVCFEPQRKSCDVRVRNTLWSLFHQDDENRAGTSAWGEIEEEGEEHIEEEEEDKETPNGKNANPGFDEVKEDIEEEEEDEDDDDDLGGEIIRALEPEIRPPQPVSAEQEIVEEEEEEEEEEVDAKTMKDHISLDAQMMKNQNQTGNKASAAASEKRDFKEIAGSFWLAASVFSKKLQKWRRKKKRDGRDPSAASARAERPASSSRFFRETQSEVADYGFGRRSCDTDPRFSLDAGRISFDDARYSFDEPRASWDGYLVGRTHPAGLPRMPVMDAVVEDAPALVRRSDNQIPVVEESIIMTSIEEDPNIIPGGSAQTRDYYLDSSSSLRRRQQSLERSGSLRRIGAAAASSACGEAEETKWASNSKVSPESLDYFLAANKFSDSKDSVPNSSSLRDDCSESFESAYREAAALPGEGGGLRKGLRKSRRWIKVWNIWGLIHRRGSSKEDDYDRYSSRGNVVDRSFSESWPELRGEANGLKGDSRGRFGGSRVFRSNSSVSWRNSFSNGTFGAGIKSSSKEADGQSKKRREEFMLERNRKQTKEFAFFCQEHAALVLTLKALSDSTRKQEAPNVGL